MLTRILVQASYYSIGFWGNLPDGAEATDPMWNEESTFATAADCVLIGTPRLDSLVPVCLSNSIIHLDRSPDLRHRLLLDERGLDVSELYAIEGRNVDDLEKSSIGTYLSTTAKGSVEILVWVNRWELNEDGSAAAAEIDVSVIPWRGREESSC